MELDQEQQPELELEQASGQLMVKHTLSQVRKDMTNIIMHPYLTVFVTEQRMGYQLFVFPFLTKK